MVNAWTYDEAGNWLTSPGLNRWNLYNNDNELTGVSANANNSVTVTGTVEPGPQSNKWYNTWAECRYARARVSPIDGTFAVPNVPLDAGWNALLVTVTDVSGNASQQTRNVFKQSLEQFQHDGNGNLTQWVNGGTTWRYEWDWANRKRRGFFSFSLPWAALAA